MLDEYGASQLLLASRSGRIGRGADLDKQSLCLAARFLASDVGNAMDAGSFVLSHSALVGILQAAGAVADKLLRHTSMQQFNFVFVPKAVAASHLQRVVACTLPTEAFCLFSSTSSTFGTFGQANYTAANTHLDVLTLSRRVKGVDGSSLQIAAVRGFVMMVTQPDEAQLEAMGAISLDEFGVCLRASLARARAARERVQAPLVHTCTSVEDPNNQPVALWRTMSLHERAARSELAEAQLGIHCSRQYQWDVTTLC